VRAEDLHKNPSFCVLPWILLATSPNGSFRLCCNSKDSHGQDREEEVTPFHRLEDGVAAYWNSDYLRKIRIQMLQKERISQCGNCYETEAAGGKSMRQRENDAWKPERFLPRIEASAHEKGLVKESPVYFDLRPGNFCNLKCIMCNPNNSHKRYVEAMEIEEAEGTGRYTREMYFFDGLQKLRVGSDLGNLDPYLSEAEEIYLAGGEPLLMPSVRELLEKILQMGKASQVRVTLNSNLTILPPDLLVTLSRFAEVRFIVSIDGLNEINRYIRFPSSWSAVQKNLASLRAFPFHLRVNTVVQAYNILQLDQILRWFHEESLNFRLILLNHPTALRILHLPKAIKEEALRRLSVVRNLPFTVEQRRDIDLVFRVLNDTENCQKPEFEKFLQFTKVMDRHREQNFFSLVPEFATYA
jgi:MoaA/NifB/PqqE/SkfB family radical SAM enzyme